MKIDLDLDGMLHGDQMTVDLHPDTPRGSFLFGGMYALRRQCYKVDGRLDRFDVAQFMPRDSTRVISGSIRADDIGFSLKSRDKSGFIAVALDEVNYKHRRFHGLSLDDFLRGDSVSASLQLYDPPIQLSGDIVGTLITVGKRSSFGSKIDLGVSYLGLQTPGLSDSIIEGSLRLTVDLYSDFTETHVVDG